MSNISSFVLILFILLTGISLRADTTRIQQLLRLSEEFENLNLDSSLFYAKKALTLALANGPEYLEGEAHNAIGIAHELKGDFDSALYHYHLALNVYDKPGLEQKAAGVMLNMGLVYRLAGETDSAIHYYEIALEIARKHNIEWLQAYVLHNIGTVYSQQDYFYSALHHYLLSLEIKDRIGDEDGLNLSRYNIGSVYAELGLLPQAHEYFTQCLEYAINNGDSISISDCYYNIASMKLRNQDTDSAMMMYRNALRIRQGIGYHEGIAAALLGIGNTFSAINKPDSALHYITQSHALFQESGLSSGVASTYLAQAELKLKLGQYREALQLSTSGRNQSEPDGLRHYTSRFWRVQAHALEGLGNPREAFRAMERFTALKDSIHQLDLNTRMLDLETRYRSAQKDIALAEQSLVVQGQKTQLLQRQRQLILAASLGLLAVLMLALFWSYYRNRRRIMQERILAIQKDREVRILKSLAEGEEKERGRLAHELHDGVSGMVAAARLSVDALSARMPGLKDEPKYRESILLLNDTASELRQVAHNLMPERLGRLGLVEAISQFIDSLTANKPLEVSFQHFNLNGSLGPTRELVVYRAVQELVHNIVKHAHATEALVQLERSGNLLLVTVEDNGTGFDTGYPGANSGSGLDALRNRLALVQARMDISSRLGEGTDVHIEMNLTE